MSSLSVTPKFSYESIRALHDACELPDVVQVKRLIEAVPAQLRRAYVNARDRWGSSPLHVAARKGHVEVVKMLLAARADVNAQYYFGFSPLSRAAEKGHVEVVRVLLDAGADVNAQNIYRWSPLHGAAEKGHVEVVRVFEVALELISAGADVKTSNQDGLPVICSAARAGNLTIVQALIEKIPEGEERASYVNMTDRWSNVALKFAAFRGHYPVVQLLIHLGANLSQADDFRDAQTALHWAVKNGHLEVVKALL